MKVNFNIELEYKESLTEAIDEAKEDSKKQFTKEELEKFLADDFLKDCYNNWILGENDKVNYCTCKISD